MPRRRSAIPCLSVRAMCWAAARCRSSQRKTALRTYLQTAVEINTEQPVLVDKYIGGKELEVDAVCDGTDVFVPGIMEHVEQTGIHSGDSISVYPTFSVSDKVKETILDYTVKLGPGHRHCGPVQHSVHRGRRGECLCHRGQPPLLAHRSLYIQSPPAVPWPISARSSCSA